MSIRIEGGRTYTHAQIHVHSNSRRTIVVVLVSELWKYYSCKECVDISSWVLTRPRFSCSIIQGRGFEDHVVEKAQVQTDRRWFTYTDRWPRWQFSRCEMLYRWVEGFVFSFEIGLMAGVFGCMWSLEIWCWYRNRWRLVCHLLRFENRGVKENRRKLGLCSKQCQRSESSGRGLCMLLCTRFVKKLFLILFSFFCDDLRHLPYLTIPSWHTSERPPHTKHVSIDEKRKKLFLGADIVNQRPGIHQGILFARYQPNPSDVKRTYVSKKKRNLTLSARSWCWYSNMLLCGYCAARHSATRLQNWVFRVQKNKGRKNMLLSIYSNDRMHKKTRYGRLHCRR